MTATFIQGSHKAALERDLRGQSFFWSYPPQTGVNPVQRTLITTQQLPDHPASKLQNAVIPGNVAAPPQVGTRILTQQLPDHPLPIILKSQPPLIGVNPVQRTLITKQELPDHPPSRLQKSLIIQVIPPQPQPILVTQQLPDHPASKLGNAVIPGNVAAPPQIGSIVIKQEIPWHSASFVVPRYIISDVAPEVVDFFFLTQQQPSHPLPRLGNAVIPGNVAAPPQVGSVVTGQQQPDHPKPQLLTPFIPPAAPPAVVAGLVARYEVPSYSAFCLVFGVQGPDAPAITSRPLLVGQELPVQPRPAMQGGISAVITATPQGRITIAQELPYHPGSVLKVAVIPGNVAAPPQVGAIVTKQEQPFHPISKLLSGAPPVPPTNPLLPAGLVVKSEVPAYTNFTLVFGVQGPDAPLIPPVLMTKQEIPAHPKSSMQGGLIPAAIVTASPEYRTLLKKQEQPQQPLPILSSNAIYVAPPVYLNEIFTDAEQPFHPAPKLFPSVNIPPVVLSAEYRTLMTKQEQPFHPASRFGSGTPPIVFTLTPEVRALMTKQEQPFHPPPGFFAGVPPVPLITISPELRKLFTIQELPDHPASKLGNAVIPGNVAAPPQIGSIVLRQELPPQPPPLLVSSFILALTPPVGKLFTTQELPYHPASSFGSGTPPVATPLVAGGGGKIMTIQELPWHPMPYLWMNLVVGASPNFARILSNTKIRVRILSNIKLRVRTLSNTNPRTVRH